MNTAASLRPHYASIASAWATFPETGGYVEHHVRGEDDESNRRTGSEKTQPASHRGWYFEGATNFGRCLFAVPEACRSNMPPLRIDVLIPCQTRWAPDTWTKLDAAKSAHMTDGRIAHLGITEYVAVVLEKWAASLPDFNTLYMSQPLGTNISIDKIGENLDATDVHFITDKNLAGRLHSVETVRKMWGLGAEDMPPSIDLRELKFERRIAKSVMTVTLTSDNEQKTYILKCRTDGAQSMYHEIKVLLTLSPHPNIIQRPPYLVTTYSKGHDEHRICGFLLVYQAGGSLEETLPLRDFTFTERMEQAKQLTAALLNIKEQSLFYSDLKMDNVLLSTTDSAATTILADFEQGRNIFTFAPPEIYYVEWLEELSADKSLDSSTRQPFADLFKSYMSSRGFEPPYPARRGPYENPPNGWYLPWLSSTPAEREAGMVFCLGKALYCIFEGVSAVSNVLGISRASDESVELPNFVKTPKKLQALIEKCTLGARETEYGGLGIVRVGSKIFPRGKTGSNGEERATVEQTKVAIKETWTKEVERTQAFVQARMRHDKGEEDVDVSLLKYLQRPTLTEVLKALQGFSSDSANM